MEIQQWFSYIRIRFFLFVFFLSSKNFNKHPSLQSCMYPFPFSFNTQIYALKRFHPVLKTLCNYFLGSAVTVKEHIKSLINNLMKFLSNMSLSEVSKSSRFKCIYHSLTKKCSARSALCLISMRLNNSIHPLRDSDFIKIIKIKNAI